MLGSSSHHRWCDVDCSQRHHQAHLERHPPRLRRRRASISSGYPLPLVWTSVCKFLNRILGVISITDIFTYLLRVGFNAAPTRTQGDQQDAAPVPEIVTPEQAAQKIGVDLTKNFPKVNIPFSPSHLSISTHCSLFRTTI